MRIFKLDTGKFVTVEGNYKNVGYDLNDIRTRVHSGISELFKYWSNKKLCIDQLEQGLLEANELDDNVLEFGDYRGQFLYSLKQVA